MARARSTRRALPARRRRIWARVNFNFAGVTTAAPTHVDLLGGLKLTGAGTMPMGVTLGPIILSAVSVETTAVVDVTPKVILGVGVFGTQDEAVDHDPALTVGLDWMLWQALHAPGTVANYPGTAGLQQSPVVTRSMRRLDEIDQTLILAVGTADTGTFNVQGWASTLVILP